MPGSTIRSPIPKIPDGRITQVIKYGASGVRFFARTFISARARGTQLKPAHSTNFSVRIEFRLLVAP